MRVNLLYCAGALGLAVAGYLAAQQKSAANVKADEIGGVVSSARDRKPASG